MREGVAWTDFEQTGGVDGGGQLRTPGRCTVVPPACQAASEGTVFHEDTNSVPAHS